MSAVLITRTLTEEQLRLSSHAIWAFRGELARGRELARQQLNLGRWGRPHLSSITLRRDSYGITMLMEFEKAEHRYRAVNLCRDCPRRWHEHAVWEKSRVVPS